MKYILSIDQGTTSSRAIIYDKNARAVSSAQREFPQIYPRPGWVEHDPDDIIGSVMAVIAESLARAGLSAQDISAVGLTNQRETTLVWDRRTGAPLCNAIVWQCRRTADMCDRLKREGLSDFIYERTGLVPDAYFSATKIKYILDSIPSARERAERGELCFGTVDTYLMWRLSGGRIFATDCTNAARTMLFNIHRREWDGELLRLFDIPRSLLPEVKESGALFGYTDGKIFGTSVPVCGVAGDQQAALYGQLCTEAGEVKNTYGTGCFLLMNTGDRAVRSANGLVTTIGASVKGAPPYVLEGSVFVGGAVVQWLRDGLKIIENAAESEALARSVSGSGGVYIVPAFTGLGAPYWDSEARGTMTGITRGTTRAHIARAALESIAYQVCDLLTAMESDSGLPVKRLSVDGGACANDFLLSFQADISGREICRPAERESTALGAAYLAGLSSGYWTSLTELRALRGGCDLFKPTMDESERLSRLRGWKNAVAAARVKI